MIDLLLMFLVAVVALLVVGALLAPVETLGWWAGWFEHGAGLDEAVATVRSAIAEPPVGVQRFIVFLCGISSEGGDALPEEEAGWVALLQVRMPAAVVVDDVFPYSVRNTPLTGDRPFAGF